MMRKNQDRPHHSARSSAQAVPFDERFLERSSRWLRDEEIRHLTLTPLFTRDQQLAWYASLAERSDYLIWGIEYGGEPVGAFGLKGLDGMSGEYWGYIGNKAYWGRGIGQWMVYEAIRYARDQGLTRLYLKVAPYNARAIKLYLSAGFSIYKDNRVLVWMERRI